MEITPKITSNNLSVVIIIAKEINRYDLLASAYYLQGVNTNDDTLIAKAISIFLSIEKEDILIPFEKEFFPNKDKNPIF